MARFKVKVDEPKWLKMIREQQRPIASAAVGALAETADNAVEEGRKQIASSGRFGDKSNRISKRDTWTSGLKARMRDAKENGEPSLQAKAIVFHTIGLAGIFEFGATISGKPLMWIPTDPSLSPPGVMARRRGMEFTSATINGTPVLFNAKDHSRHRKPLYIGVPTIRIPKKWNITEIVEKHAARLALLFIKRFRGS